MFIFRWLGLLFLVFALMLLGADIVSSLEMPSASVVRSLDKILMLLGADAKPWIERNFLTVLVEPGLTFLSWPGWISTALLGVILVLFGSLRGRARIDPEHHHAESIER